MIEPRKAVRKFPKRVVEKPTDDGAAPTVTRRRRPAGPMPRPEQIGFLPRSTNNKTEETTDVDTDSAN